MREPSFGEMARRHPEKADLAADDRSTSHRADDSRERILALPGCRCAGQSPFLERRQRQAIEDCLRRLNLLIWSFRMAKQ
jgi:hypothetical protein